MRTSIPYGPWLAIVLVAVAANSCMGCASSLRKWADHRNRVIGRAIVDEGSRANEAVKQVAAEVVETKRKDMLLMLVAGGSGTAGGASVLGLLFFVVRTYLKTKRKGG